MVTRIEVYVKFLSLQFGCDGMLFLELGLGG